MRRARVVSTVVAVLALGMVVVPARASERSELLVARGEVAYAGGRVDEARAYFQQALDADPNDATARSWLELIASRVPLAAAPGQRRERAARIWDVEAGTGVEYDSNPALDHSSPRGDAGFLFTFDGHVDPWRDDKTLVRLDYDFFQVLHTSLNEFNVTSNRVRATVARAIVPSLWAGLQGGYDHTVLHTHAYLQEPWVMPYLSILQGGFGSTQLLYRHSQQGYLGSPFGGTPYDRTGPSNGAGVNQLVFLFDGRMALNLGYFFFQQTPHAASGSDFALHSQQGIAGVRFPAWWQTFVEVDYVYRNDSYTNPNSFATPPDSAKRTDHGSYFAGYVRRPIMDHLDALLSYFPTINSSNIALYDYHRQIVALELRYTF